MKKANGILKLLASYEGQKAFVYRVISRFKADKTLEPKPRTSRPIISTEREGRMIVKMVLKDRFDIATSIYRAFCENTGKPITRKTVSRWLNKEKIVARIPRSKPLISGKNSKVRLDFVTEYITWTEEQWNIIHCSDESKSNFFVSDGKRFVRRRN